MIARSLLVTLIGVAVWLVVTPGSVAQESGCRQFEDTDVELCDQYLDYWEMNGGEDAFGKPLTPPFAEIDPATQENREVQYFENARLESHPELADTPFEIQAGRLGAELLAAEGVDWRALPEADPDDDYYFEETGQAIAPEFREYWTAYGLDLGDKGVSSSESIGRFGYPLTPAEHQSGEEVLVQWFERARLQMDDSGEVTVAPLGVLADDDTDGLSIRLEREIEATVKSVFERHDTPGLGVWLDSPELGERAWTEGYADHEAEEPYTADTHHRIGSVTKTFIATLVLQLVDEGELDLDDTIDQWFPELDGGDEVTVRMLGNMTSGIFNYTESIAWQSAVMQEPDRVWEPAELVEYGFEMTETATPDSDWAYSNTNYIMLGMIIEDVTGNDVRDELDERTLEPLGLENTSFPESGDTSMPEPFARGVPDEGLGSIVDGDTEWNPSWASSAGEMVSTPSDLFRWLQEVEQGELLSEEMQEERFDLVEVPESAEGTGYGIGVLSIPGWSGHDGLLPGYETFAFQRPDIDVSLVSLANSDTMSDAQTLSAGAAFAEIQRILNREYPLPED